MDPDGPGPRDDYQSCLGMHRSTFKKAAGEKIGKTVF